VRKSLSEVADPAKKSWCKGKGKIGREFCGRTNAGRKRVPLGFQESTLEAEDKGGSSKLGKRLENGEFVGGHLNQNVIFGDN